MSAIDDKLVRMAEQIAANNAHAGDAQAVAERVADHINRFWDPRMRAGILRHVGATDAPLSDALRLALTRVNPPAP